MKSRLEMKENMNSERNEKNKTERNISEQDRVINDAFSSDPWRHPLIEIRGRI